MSYLGYFLFSFEKYIDLADIDAKVSLASNGISLLTNILLFYVFAFFPALQSKLAYRLIVAVAFSDAIMAAGWCLGKPSPDDWLCTSQGFLITFGSCCSSLWVANITYVLHKVSQPVIPAHEVEKKEKWFHAYTWLLSLGISLVPLYTNGYGRALGYCWITDNHLINIIWRFVSFYGPRVLVILYSISVYFQTQGVLSSTQASQRLKWYPLALGFCSCFGLINRVIQIWHPEENANFLTVLQAFFQGIYGMINAILFFNSSLVRKTVKNHFYPDHEIETDRDPSFGLLNESPELHGEDPDDVSVETKTICNSVAFMAGVVPDWVTNAPREV